MEEFYEQLGLDYSEVLGRLALFVQVQTEYERLAEAIKKIADAN
mgnify:FL=1